MLSNHGNVVISLGDFVAWMAGIADPYQIITWVTPGGGGGPDYKRL